MPRVLVQLTSLGLGGTQINAVDFAVQIAGMGYESILIGPADTVPKGPSLYDVAKERNVELNSYVRPATVLSGARQMFTLAKRYRADLLHVYGSWNYRPAWWGACTFGRRPLVLTVYEMSIDPLAPRHLPLIVGTNYLKEELRHRRGSVRLISPPVDLIKDATESVSRTALIKRLNLDPKNLRVVMVCRLDEEMKAAPVKYVIDAIQLMQRKDVDMVIVGTGNAEARLKNVAEAANRNLGRKAIIFAGPMADPRIAYAAADVMVGMGGSAARTLAFGKPLIASGEAGWFRLFTPETSALLFDSSFWSPDEVACPVHDLAKMLAQLLDDARLRESLGEFGRSFAETHFGLPAMSSRLADTYTEALDTSGPTTWVQDLPLEANHLVRKLRSHALPVNPARLKRKNYGSEDSTGGKL